MLSAIKAYFSFSKWESISVIVLCSVIFCLVGINYSMPYWVTQPTAMSSADHIALQKLAAQIHADTTNQKPAWKHFEKYIPGDGSKINAFAFDPNTLDSNGFIRLGLSAKTVHDIINYRNHGAVFYNKEKFSTVYSLSEAEYKKLAPFISISPTKKYTNTYTPREKVIVEINSADTALFNKLYGIGPVLAQRIVELRTQLGGFYSIAQLQEVYGITDTTMQKIKPQLRIDASKISKIHINTVLYQTLNAHPYFKNGLALAIMKLKKNNDGKIDNVAQLKSIVEIDAAKLERAMKYIVID
jgi:competence protein ComEA